jgi:hypothetical protein
MYAFIVKNSQDTWDVWETMGTIPIQDREERLQAALASEFPIVGQILTPYKEQATSGAVWDGEKFNGIGNVHPSSKIEDFDWDTLTQYGFVCNGTILLIMYSQPNVERDAQFQAIFESEASIIQVPEGQYANVGDIWDGTNMINN